MLYRFIFALRLRFIPIYIGLYLLLSITSCAGRPSNAIDALAEEVIKKKEGVDIRIAPIDEEKGAKVLQKDF